MSFAPLRFRTTEFGFDRPYLVGVLNITPDSFSDGGVYDGHASAVERAIELARVGADVVDIGGESTRPGALPVDTATELGRVLPVIEALTRNGFRPAQPCVLSVDTTKAQVAQACINAGAEIINDISGGLFDPSMRDVIETTDVTYILGHVRGGNIDQVHQGESTPPSTQQVIDDLGQRLSTFSPKAQQRIIVDPGLGFGKPAALNLELCARVDDIVRALGRPVMVGPSRKRFVAATAGADLLQRDAGTIGACLASLSSGAHFLRAHAVELLEPAVAMYELIRKHRSHS